MGIFHKFPIQDSLTALVSHEDLSTYVAVGGPTEAARGPTGVESETQIDPRQQ